MDLDPDRGYKHAAKEFSPRYAIHFADARRNRILGNVVRRRGADVPRGSLQASDFDSVDRVGRFDFNRDRVSFALQLRRHRAVRAARNSSRDKSQS
jgi:hypothetical protein